MAQATASSNEQHPNPIPNPHHRKIELQSLADLTYLQQNLATAAREKLDLHFPPQHSTSAPAEVINLGGPPIQEQAEKEPDEDPLRRNVRLLIDSFLQQTFTSASHSLSINGIDATTLRAPAIPTCSNPDPSTADQSSIEVLDPADEIEGIHYTYASYDPRISKRLQTLHQEVESLTSEVSQLRRTAPKQAADAYATALEAALKSDEEHWEAEKSKQEKIMGLELEKTRDGWNEDVRRTFAHGVDQLAVLSNIAAQKQGSGVSLMETAGKVQRARRVAAEFD